MTALRARATPGLRARAAGVLLPLAAGALLPLSLAPFDLWPLGIVSLALWFHALRRPGASGAWTGWWFGVGKYGVGASWVYVSIHVYGNAPPPLAVFLVAVFVAGLALFPMVNGWLFGRLAADRPWHDAIVFVALFGAFEWLLTWFLTGFPWLYAGYAHLTTPLAGLGAPGRGAAGGLRRGARRRCVGARGHGPGAAALATRGQRDRSGPGPLGARWRGTGHRLGRGRAAPPGGAGAGRHPAEREVGAGAAAAILDTYLTLSEAHWNADLIIWPEAAITYMAHEARPILADLDRRGAAAGTACCSACRP
jgi:apolipoprotein N-acyltransferase